MARIILITGVLIAASLPVLAGDTPQPPKIRGEVVASRLSPATAGEPACAEVQVRTRDRQHAWLRLGPAEEMAGKFQNGDIVRARVMKGGGQDAALAREVRNERTGERMQIRDGSGNLLRERDRDRLRDGSGTGDRARDRDRSRDRVHQPGTGGGRGGGGRGGR